MKMTVANIARNQAIVADMIPWIIYHYAEVDKWDNAVTIIERCDGKKFRMVHHSKPFHKKQHYTIYEGRNRFIKVTICETPSDTQMDWCRAHRYTVYWGDGDNLGSPEIDESISIGDWDDTELRNKLSSIQNNAYFEVILTILNHIDTIEAWQSKETKNV